MVMDFNDYLNLGIRNIVGTIARFYIKDRKGRAFIHKIGSSFNKAIKRRNEYERNEIHVPPFLIASITSNCNLHCTGCYALANGGCGQNCHTQDEMSVSDWHRVFKEASDIGISFILLAGGEPLLRKDIIEMAAEFENIIFPIFTNGTMIDDQYLFLFEKHRNLVPILSIEGDEAQTDERRGSGVYQKIKTAAHLFKAERILYGASITVTNENISSVTEHSYVSSMCSEGCGIIFYIEYVPAEEKTEHLVLSEADLQGLQEKIELLRKDRVCNDITILSFPGDEVMLGGCLAAGRGFFHINANGSAEPCPFSPYSEMSLKDHSIIEVLQSPFFAEIQKISAAEALNHKGGCTLFQHKDKVSQII